MRYRVFDTKNKIQITSTVVTDGRGDIFVCKQGWFKRYSLKLLPDHRYVVHRCVEIKDKNDKDIFEGDICVAKDGVFTGVVTYVPEHASFYLLCDAESTFYPLGFEYQELLEVIGNVIENPEMISIAEVSDG